MTLIGATLSELYVKVGGVVTKSLVTPDARYVLFPRKSADSRLLKSIAICFSLCWSDCCYGS